MFDSGTLEARWGEEGKATCWRDDAGRRARVDGALYRVVAGVGCSDSDGFAGATTRWNSAIREVGALLLVAVALFMPMASTAMPDMLGAALVLAGHGKAGCMEGRA